MKNGYWLLILLLRDSTYFFPMQIVGPDEARVILQLHKESTHQMIESSNDLLKSGKKKEVQKVLNRIHDLM
jgi:hypothetical protein